MNGWCAQIRRSLARGSEVRTSPPGSILIFGAVLPSCGHPYVQSPDIAVQLHQALGQAVLTFLARVLPVRRAFSVRQLWLRGCP